MKPNNRSGVSDITRPSQGDVLAPAKLTEAVSDLEPKVVGESLDSSYTPLPPKKRQLWHRSVGLSLLGVGFLGAVLLTLHTMSVNKNASMNATPVDKSAALKPQTIPLSDLGLKPINLLPETNQITVNGSVNVADSLILSPTTTPNGAVAGQLYFDQTKNQLAYFNGSNYVYLLQPSSGASSVTNNSVTNNITNVTNSVTNDYGTTGITAINGTAGSVAMFDGLGALTESLITQSGSNLSTGTGVEHVTIGSTNGTSGTIVQGGTGNVAINTGAVTGTSGTITIESGASSTTAAGNVTVDTGESIINGTLISDKDFEDGTTDNLGDGIYGDNSTVTVSSAQAHGGSKSLSIAVGSNYFPNWGIADGTGNPPMPTTVVAGHTYAMQAWVRAGTNSDNITAGVTWSYNGYYGGGQISTQTFGTVTDNSSGWQKVAGVLTAPNGANKMGFYFTAGDAQTIGEVHYFDDITITDLTTSPSEAALNLGTTNAQVITIGNSGMLAPTSIYGSGINLSAGSGFINGTGTYFSLAGASGGSISTATGPLTLTSGTSASWGIGGGYYGGSLALYAGSAGGNNNGGALTIQSGAGAGTGGSGTVQVTTPSGVGASGAISLQTGDSSTTAAGSVSIDTGNSTITGLQVDNLTFETGTDSMNFWGGTGTATQDCSQAHTGNCSLNITGFSSASVWEDSGDFGWAVTPGHAYAFSFWVKAASTAEPVSGAVSWGMAGGGWTWSGSPTITDTSTGWTEVTWTATAPAGAQYGDFELGNINGPGTTHYFDDVVATDMSSGSAFSSLNLGAVNAQGVNIGNVNQINATTIDGGGISLHAGQGNLDISGGATTVTASGPATVTSTGAALTLSGAGGSGNGVVVKPQADSSTAFLVQSAGGGTNMLTVGTANPQVINDDMVNNAPTGTFSGGASWVPGQYVELDNGGPGLDGEVNYKLSNVGNSFNASFNFWSKTGGGDGTFLYAYGQRTPATFHLGTFYGGAGYIFAYADTAMGGYAGIYYDGTQLASAPISATDTSTWHSAQVTKVGSTFTMYLDGNSVLTYTDTSPRDLSGTNFGVGGCSCSYNGEHRATNLVLSGDPFVTTGGSAQLGGNVAVAGSLTAAAINTSQISTASSLTVKPWVNSTDAFSIQSAYDATLFAVDTTNSVITISAKLQVNGDLGLSGHFTTSGTTPTYTAGAAACTAPTITVSGNDTSGTISVKAGSSCPGAGTLATITFANAFGANPHVVVTPGSSNAAGLNAYVDDSTETTNTFNLGVSSAPTTGATYVWNYFVVQ